MVRRLVCVDLACGCAGVRRMIAGWEWMQLPPSVITSLQKVVMECTFVSSNYHVSKADRG